jgi:hypothetical protein
MRPAPRSIYIPHVYDKACFYRKDLFIFGGAFAFSRHTLVNIGVHQHQRLFLTPHALGVVYVSLTNSPLFFIPAIPGLGGTERSFPFLFAKHFSFTVRRLSSPIFKVAGFLLHYLPYCGKGLLSPQTCPPPNDR